MSSIELSENLCWVKETEVRSTVIKKLSSLGTMSMHRKHSLLKVLRLRDVLSVLWIVSTLHLIVFLSLRRWCATTFVFGTSGRVTSAGVGGCVSCIAIIMAIVITRRSEYSGHMLLAVLSLSVVALSNMLRTWRLFFEFATLENECASTPYVLLNNFEKEMNHVTKCLFMWLIVERIGALQVATVPGLNLKVTLAWLLLAIYIVVCAIIEPLVDRSLEWKSIYWQFSEVASLFLVIVQAAVLYLAYRALNILAGLISEAPASIALEQERRIATSVLAELKLWVMAMACLRILVFSCAEIFAKIMIARGNLEGSSAPTRAVWVSTLVTAPRLIHDICMSASNLAVSGALFDSAADTQHGDIRLERQATLRESWKPDACENWQSSVEDLANRAFSLESLLAFYQGLGSQYMVHFRSDQHTTNDVVRQAIIPLTEAAGCCYSEIMMQGKPTRPERMVTHNWGNKFRDLVSVIVADALEEGNFSQVADLLDTDFELLKKWLRKKGTLQRTYWVCAFCIAQHYSICCADSSAGLDTVTQKPFPTCACSRPKLLNSTPPCREDGSSIPCEMNKFSDMIRFLAATEEDFQHVVAVDQTCTLFTRAWCVAEVAEAFHCGVKQKMKIHSRGSLERYSERLQDLRVEDMQASRPEDIVEILASIPDKDEFNEQLQKLIFDDCGLLASWQSVGVKQQMAFIGMLGSRAYISQQVGSSRTL